MKKRLIYLFSLLTFSTVLLSCEKDYDGLGPLEDSIADIPVTVTNRDFFELVPIVTASVANGGNFSITFQIPSDKGRIREITRVATGTSAVVNLQGSTPRLIYNYDTPSQTNPVIIGNGTNEITFSSTLATYTAYRTRVTAAVAGPAATVSVTPSAPTQLRFFFLLTLEDGTQIIPTEVRVRVVE